MASIGKFALSLASGAQETTIALANVTLDFAMIRLEAPKEYQGLGTTLSKKRKHEAEQGQVHATARRLGALFADDMPHISNLSCAYGLRASEIAEDPSFNPVGDSAAGPLAGHVGADGTSIWAAATSGRGALHVHLLACLLARIWSAPEATAIWSELVAARRSILEDSLRGLEFQASALTASQIEIAPERLAEWDASARAWLRTGDKAMLLRQKQLMLIVENIGLPIPSRPQLFDSVMAVWKKSMVTVDKLVSGIAQHIQDPEVMVGISAWHIYPDMVCLGKETTVVKQNDHLVQKGGLITVGMENTNLEKLRGISWTMPLAQLQYYGKPETRIRSVGEQSLRAPFSDLVYVAMGSVISTWKLHADDLEAICNFFVSIWESLKRSNKETIAAFGWHELFSQQGKIYLQAKPEEKMNIQRLVNLGRRRFASFMAPEPNLAPGYGLCSFDNSLQFLTPDDQIKAVREMAMKYDLGIDLHGGFIVYQSENSHGSCVEIASLFPYRLPNENEIQRRWTCPITLSWAEDYKGSSSLQYMAISYSELDGLFDSEGTVKRSIDLRKSTGELCGFISADTFTSPKGALVTTWIQEEKVYWRADRRSLALHYLGIVTESYNRIIDIPSQQMLAWTLSAMPHDYENVEYVRAFSTDSIIVYQPEKLYSGKNVTVPLSCLTDTINSGSLDKHLRTYFNISALRQESITYSTRSTESTRQQIQEQNRDIRQIQRQVHCLFALYKASLVYSKLPSADIDLSVASRPLIEAEWARIEGKAVVSIPRTEAFSCVTMFDTGCVNLDPSHFADVMAISSGNTLYVSEMLLNDPCQPLLEMGIRCLIGNIGRPGVSLLMSPREPILLEPSLDTWEEVNHTVFDGKIEDNFKGTSLHLSLTGYEQAIHIPTNQSRRYKEVSYVEAVVSAYDRGKWVGDLDILSLYRHSSGFLSNLGSDVINAMKAKSQMERVVSASCSHQGLARNDYTLIKNVFGRIIAIDNWPELLDPPPNTAVIRANGNWIARLALAAAVHGREDSILFTSGGICWSCIEQALRSLNFSPERLFILC